MIRIASATVLVMIAATATPAFAQSDLSKRVLEALAAEEAASRETGKKPAAPEKPAQPAADAKKPSPVVPPVPAKAAEKPVRGVSPKLPGFSQVAPTPQTTARPEPKKAELPRPAPRVIEIQREPRPVARPAPPKPVRAKPAAQPEAGTRSAPVKQGAVTSDTYTIQSGDTFSSVALRLYGEEAKWIAIAKANPLIDPVRLKVGQVIRLPDLAQQEQERSKQIEKIAKSLQGPSAKAGEIRVEPGDNLSKIAHRVYGKAVHWRKIYEANRDQLDDPDDLKVGMKLKIPPLPEASTTASGGNG